MSNFTAMIAVDNFYNDAEVYPPSTSTVIGSSPGHQLYSFPNHQFTSFAASLTFDKIGNAFFDCISTSPSPPTHEELPHIHEAIPTPQVQQFWTLYHEYPAFLKKQKKKPRRKGRKSSK